MLQNMINDLVLLEVVASSFFIFTNEYDKAVANLQNNRTGFYLSIFEGLKDDSNARSDNYALR